MREGSLDAAAFDVGGLVQSTVASLYAHLVTRPTGRAVRLAIETRLADLGPRSLSLIDLSEVTILDFSCADEVVAKLLQRYEGAEEAFFVFSGVYEPHRDQIEVVLERHGLAAVAQTAEGRFELLGARTPEEDEAWRALEDAGELEAEPPEGEGLQRLARRRLAFRHPGSGRYAALSHLLRALLPGSG